MTVAMTVGAICLSLVLGLAVEATPTDKPIDTGDPRRKAQKIAGGSR